mmetsp:Transcript_117467/g.328855  ORF Transcript_117467/g.328855 Transcript_117467/m.328855 type:complete len:273 (+) Transcript_117467:1-819(+)
MGDETKRRRYCKMCNVWKPDRTHHCSICNRCILNMDHHCPWINNCVGLHNHKYFLLLGIYAWLASLVALGTALPELVRCAGIAIGLESVEALQLEEGSVQMLDIWSFLIFGFFASSIALLLTSLLSTHVPLACRNLTTIEDFYENMPNPFDRGSRLANLAQVFGEPGVDWLLPVRPRRPTSDGILYPQRRLGRRAGAVRPEELQLVAAEVGDAGVWASLHEDGGGAAEAAWRIHYQVLAAEDTEAGRDQGLGLSHLFACGGGARSGRVGRVA